MQLIVYPVTVFCLGMPEIQVSHVCIQRAESSICFEVVTLFWGGARGGSAIYYWLLFQYLILDTISIFFSFT